MPKTATGKVQRKNVAKAMIDKEKEEEALMAKRIALKEKEVSGVVERSSTMPFFFVMWKKLFIGLWRLFC